LAVATALGVCVATSSAPSAGGSLIDRHTAADPFSTSVPIVAHTSQVVLDDDRADVWKHVTQPRSRWLEERRQPTVDILRTVIRHGATDVTLRMRIADVRWVGRLDVPLFMWTPDHRAFLATVESSPGNRRGIRHQQLSEESEGLLIPCAGFKTSVDRNTDVAWMRIPRECMGDPTWLIAKTWSAQMPPGLANHDFFDAARSSGHHPGGWTRRLYARH
jgi:hypothetical protein